MLAGGAWSRLFCGNLGLSLPQLKVRGSVLRTEPLEGARRRRRSWASFAFRKRLDGGYSIANGLNTLSDLVPDSFRLLADFLPALRLEYRSLHFRLGGRFLEEWRTPRRWRLDEPSPSSGSASSIRPRTASFNDAARASLRGRLPGVRQGQGRAAWAGMIDVTPDAVPVISAVDSLPGFFIATGFSGHGFGIGPGAGRLMADLVTGSDPIVDPTPFRFLGSATARGRSRLPASSREQEQESD